MCAVAQSTDLYVGKMVSSERHLFREISGNEMLLLLTADCADVVTPRCDMVSVPACVAFEEQSNAPL